MEWGQGGGKRSGWKEISSRKNVTVRKEGQSDASVNQDTHCHWGGRGRGEKIEKGGTEALKREGGKENGKVKGGDSKERGLRQLKREVKGTWLQKNGGGKKGRKGGKESKRQRKGAFPAGRERGF